MTDSFVLVSWIAYNNDPYERNRNRSFRRDPESGKKIPGPTLTLLFDADSPYKGRVSDVVLLHQDPASGNLTAREVAEETRAEILTRAPSIQVTLHPWAGNNPTDYNDIYAFLRAYLPTVRARYGAQALLIHVSPGTPQMQTVWMLMGATGMIPSPFQTVQSIPTAKRMPGDPAAIPVGIDIETYFKAYEQATPHRVASSVETLALSPLDFRSARMKQLYREATRYARLKVPVLILGARGTGKTTLASWIRANSPFRSAKKDKGWATVPCGQYTTETVRAELFGYVKGAFTGAKSDATGLLHLADGDTLFLDELGDLSTDVQRLLVRAIEQKEFQRLGSSKIEKSDFRLICATNRTWDELQELLDLDFLDRISTVILEMPPLCEIDEEVPVYWPSVLAKACEEAGLTPGTIRLPEAETRRIVEALAAHPLPGNLRDIFRVAYRLIGALHDRVAPSDAVDYALEKGLVSHPSRQLHSEADLHRVIAQAFASGDSLYPSFKDIDYISTDRFFKTLQHYLSTEIYRLARIRGVKPENLFDKTLRTLQMWQKHE